MARHPLTHAALNDLFDASAAQEPDLTPSGFLTNRNVLLLCLSAGMIATREGMPDEQYRRDLLDVAPGRIPVLPIPVPAGLADLVASEGTGNFPILLELGRLPEGTEHMEGGEAHAVTGPVEFSRVRRVVFRSEQDLDEFQARKYAGVPPFHGDVVVEPDAFSGDGDGEGVLSWLEDLPVPEQRPDSTQYEIEDRIGGGVAVAIAVAPEYRKALVAMATGDAGDGEGWLRHALLPGAGPAPDTEDGLYLTQTVEALLETPREEWRPRDILRRIADRIRELDPDGIIAVRQSHIHDRAKAILEGEMAFSGFSDGTGESAARALLVFLTRPTPEAYTDDTMRAYAGHPMVAATAGLFSGIMKGRASLDLSVRPGPLDDELARIAVDRLSGRGRDEALVVEEPETEVSGGDAPNDVPAPDVPADAAPADLPDPDPAPEPDATSPRTGRAASRKTPAKAAPAESDAVADDPEPEKAFVTVDALLEIDALNEARLRRTASRLAKRSGWMDCFSYRIELAPGTGFHVEPGGARKSDPAMTLVPESVQGIESVLLREVFVARLKKESRTRKATRALDDVLATIRPDA